VSGKLDTHASVYDWAKIQNLIKNKDFAGKDPYGLPILDLKKSLHTQVEVGLGPLHTQYDSKPCVVYTSIYVDSMVTKWDYCKGKVLDQLHIHYNIGHLMTMEGDSVKPQGKWLVSLNKLAIDRFNPVGPLHPQNHQLIDISGDKMILTYDMPVPLGEPHYAVAIRASKLKPIVRYRLGWNSREDKKSEYRTRPGREKIVTDENGVVHVYGTVIRSHITPEIIEVEEGTTVSIHLTNVERAEDETHGFAISGTNVNLSIEPGKTVSEGVKYTEADYKKQYEQNLGVQKVIDSVVNFIVSRNFKDFPTVVGLVEDATDQLKFAADAKKKAEDYAAKKDWQNATLWAQQWFQYQVKAGDEAPPASHEGIRSFHIVERQGVWRAGDRLMNRMIAKASLAVLLGAFFATGIGGAVVKGPLSAGKAVAEEKKKKHPGKRLYRRMTGHHQRQAQGGHERPEQAARRGHAGFPCGSTGQCPRQQGAGGADRRLAGRSGARQAEARGGSEAGGCQGGRKAVQEEALPHLPRQGGQEAAEGLSLYRRPEGFLHFQPDGGCARQEAYQRQDQDDVYLRQEAEG